MINEAKLKEGLVNNINIQIYHINRGAEPVFTMTLTIQRLWVSYIYSVPPQGTVKVQLSLHKCSSWFWVEVDTLSNMADEGSMERSVCWYIAWSYPRQFRVTSLHCCALQRDQHHLNQTDGWNASSTDYFHFSSFMPSARLFVSLHLFCRLLYRYRNVCLQMFLSVGLIYFRLKTVSHNKTCNVFLNSFRIRENFCVKILQAIKLG